MNSPKVLIFPVSAIMGARQREYDAALETGSVLLVDPILQGLRFLNLASEV